MQFTISLTYLQLKVEKEFTIKLFTAKINATMLRQQNANVSHFQPNLIFTGKAMNLSFAPALASNLRRG